MGHHTTPMLLLSLGLAATAGMAHADGGTLSMRPAIAVSDRPLVLPSPRSDPAASAIEAAVLPKRSIDRRLADGVTGSAGFLCGRQAGVNNGGGFEAGGYDPQGRFIGAKLSFAFR